MVIIVLFVLFDFVSKLVCFCQILVEYVKSCRCLLKRMQLN